MAKRNTAGTESELLSIGALGKALGVAATALRYYEREGVLAPTSRSPVGYRLYDQRALKQLEFIRAAQAVGFTLADIRALADLESRGGRNGRRKAEVRDVIERRLVEVEQKMGDLRRVQAALREALKGCQGSSDRECPVLEELHSGTSNATQEVQRGSKRRKR